MDELVFDVRSELVSERRAKRASLAVTEKEIAKYEKLADRLLTQARNVTVRGWVLIPHLLESSERTASREERAQLERARDLAKQHQTELREAADGISDRLEELEQRRREFHPDLPVLPSFRKGGHLWLLAGPAINLEAEKAGETPTLPMMGLSVTAPAFEGGAVAGWTNYVVLVVDNKDMLGVGLEHGKDYVVQTASLDALLAEPLYDLLSWCEMARRGEISLPVGQVLVHEDGLPHVNPSVTTWVEATHECLEGPATVTVRGTATNSELLPDHPTAYCLHCRKEPVMIYSQIGV